jgi:LmbE family N-acetylglucosaminyl deacetylase
MMKHLAAEEHSPIRRRGVHIMLVCATRGEVGEISDPALATPETLGNVREAELRNAAQVLGLTDVRFLATETQAWWYRQ